MLQIQRSAKESGQGRRHLPFKGFSTTYGTTVHTTKKSGITLIVKGKTKTA